MICGRLESCGRFFYRNQNSHQKTKLLLDQLKKKKQAKALDPRLNSQLENAIYACNPPVVTRILTVELKIPKKTWEKQDTEILLH